MPKIRRSTRHIVIPLDRDEYAELETRAEKEHRDPHQQARHVLAEWLADNERREPVEAAS